MNSFEAIVEQLRKLDDPDGRAAFLETACAGDLDLRRRVEDAVGDLELAKMFLGGDFSSGKKDCGIRG